MHQIRFRLGAPLQTPLGELTCPHDPYQDLRGPTSKGMEGRNDRRKGQEMGRREGTYFIYLFYGWKVNIVERAIAKIYNN